MHLYSRVNVKNFATEGSPFGRIVSLVAVVFFAAFAVFVSIRHFAPLYPLKRHGTDDAAAMTEPFAALSSTSRANRRTKVSIQRLAPSLPPAISAELLS